MTSLILNSSTLCSMKMKDAQFILGNETSVSEIFRFLQTLQCRTAECGRGYCSFC